MGDQDRKSNAQLSIKDVLLGTLSGKYTLAEAGQLALNAAMEANPIGLVITAISGLIAVVSALAGIFGNQSDEVKEAQESYEEYIDSIEDMVSESKKN